MQNSSIGEVEGKMAEVLMATSVETIKNRDCVDGVIFLLLISPFLTFLLPLEIEDNFINPGLIYSEMHFIWEVGACFLKGQERHHSFESLVVCFSFLLCTSFSPSVSLVIFFWWMVRINQPSCHKAAFTLLFPKPEEWSTYSIKVITQSKCVELTLHVTHSKRHLRVFKTP